MMSDSIEALPRLAHPPRWLIPANTARGQAWESFQDDIAPAIPQPLTFREFQLWPGAHKLLRGGKPVELGSRAFDLLLILLRSRGRLVSKEEIVRQVWPTTFVEESNLRFQVATLRKALGRDGDIIKTIPGRGYLLIEEEEELGGAQPKVVRSGSPRSNGGGPRYVEAEGVSPTEKAAARPDRAPVIAVVDPDAEARYEISRVLEHEGICVRPHESVEAFLGSEKPFDLDCLILELWQPGRGGIDLQRDLAKVRPTLPLIFMSGQADVHTAVQAMKLGAKDFLVKPVRHLELLHSVRMVLGRVEKENI